MQSRDFELSGFDLSGETMQMYEGFARKYENICVRFIWDLELYKWVRMRRGLLYTLY